MTCSRWYIGFAVLLTTISCAGALFGFPTLALTLTRIGAFSSDCPAGTETTGTCTSQSLIINKLFVAGATTSFISPIFVGAFQQRFGPAWTMRLTSTVFALGAGLGVGAASQGAPEGLWYGFCICLGFSATALVLPLYDYAALFPANSGLALGLLNGCFDAATVVFLIISEMAKTLPLRNVLIGYLCVPVLILLLHAVFLWPSKPWSATRAEKEAAEAAAQAAAALPTIADAAPPAIVVAVPDAALPAADTPTSASSMSGGSTRSLAAATVEAAAVKLAPASSTGSTSASAELVPAAAAPSATTAAAAEKPVADTAAKPVRLTGLEEFAAMPMLKQLQSAPFLTYICFFTAEMLLYNWFIGTLDSRLTLLGQVNGNYTSLSGIIFPCGFFFQFVCGPVLDRFGVGVSLWIQWLLGLLLTVLCSIQILQVQVGSMVVFAAFRAWHFSNMTVYLSSVFGFPTLSVTIGTVVLVGGCIGQLQSPLLQWALDSPSAFLDPSLTMLGVQLACFAFPLWNTLFRMRRARAAAGGSKGSSTTGLALPSPASGASSASAVTGSGKEVELAGVALAVAGTTGAAAAPGPGPATREAIGVADSVGGSALLARAPSDGGFAVPLAPTAAETATAGAQAAVV